MIFKELGINGAFLIKSEKHTDERGSFTRQFCKKELKNAGIDFEIKQSNISKNEKKGVLRGLHYQKEPCSEKKIVSCVQGACFNVIVDLRKDSQDYLKWVSVELSENNDLMIFIPPMCAHGFLTLEDKTGILYYLNEYFSPRHYAGLRWDDPKIAVNWPECGQKIINDRDKNYELL